MYRLGPCRTVFRRCPSSVSSLVWDRTDDHNWSRLVSVGLGWCDEGKPRDPPRTGRSHRRTSERLTLSLTVKPTSRGMGGPPSHHIAGRAPFGESSRSRPRAPGSATGGPRSRPKSTTTTKVGTGLWSCRSSCVLGRDGTRPQGSSFGRLGPLPWVPRGNRFSKGELVLRPREIFTV